MKRSGMPRPTSCDLSHDTKRFKDNNVYEDTEPPPGTNILLNRSPCGEPPYVYTRLIILGNIFFNLVKSYLAYETNNP